MNQNDMSCKINWKGDETCLKDRIFLYENISLILSKNDF